MDQTDIPKFKHYAEGEPIPPVDPEDIKRMHDYERTHTKVNSIGWQWLQGLKAALSPEADFSDVSSRHRMVETLPRYNKGQLLVHGTKERNCTKLSSGLQQHFHSGSINTRIT